NGRKTSVYWTESGRDRMELLAGVVELLSQHRWGRIVDSGWTDWDLRIYCHPLIYLEGRTTPENHCAGERLIRVEKPARLPEFAVLATTVAAAILVGTFVVDRTAGIAALAVTSAAAMTVWSRCTRLAGQAATLFEHVAKRMGMVRCGEKRKTEP